MNRDTELNLPESMAPWLRSGVEAGHPEPVGDALTEMDALAAHRFSIPMAPTVESLNVSVTAAVALYEHRTTFGG